VVSDLDAIFRNLTGFDTRIIEEPINYSIIPSVAEEERQNYGVDDMDHGATNKSADSMDNDIAGRSTSAGGGGKDSGSHSVPAENEHNEPTPATSGKSSTPSTDPNRSIPNKSDKSGDMSTGTGTSSSTPSGGSVEDVDADLGGGTAGTTWKSQVTGTQRTRGEELVSYQGFTNAELDAAFRKPYNKRTQREKEAVEYIRGESARDARKQDVSPQPYWAYTEQEVAVARTKRKADRTVKDQQAIDFYDQQEKDKKAAAKKAAAREKSSGKGSSSKSSKSKATNKRKSKQAGLPGLVSL